MPNNNTSIKKQLDDAYRRGFIDCFRQEARRSEIMFARFENQNRILRNITDESEVLHER